MNQSCRVGVWCGVVATVVAATWSAHGQQDWPGFRGVSGSAVASTAIDVDALEPTVVWRVPVGSGYSGVSVAGGTAVTMGEMEGAQFLFALDAATGQELWRRRVGPSHPGRDGSWTGPLATPVIAGTTVVGLGAWGNLVAHDLRDGEPRWSLHLRDDLGAERPYYGFASSPLVTEGTLVVQAGGSAGSVLGLDPATGQVLWRVGVEPVAYQVPVVVELAGRATLVAGAGESLFGIEPTDGEVLWRYPYQGSGDMGVESLTPVAAGEGRIFITHTNEASQMLRLSGGRRDTAVERLWLNNALSRSYTPSVFHDGHLYGYAGRILVCVDAATGERKWRSRAPGDGFLAVVGEVLVILTKEGTLHLVHADSERYDEITSAAVFDELVWTPPSFAEGDLFVRSLNEVARVDLHGGGTALSVETDFGVPGSLDPGDGPFGRFVRSVEASARPAELVDAFFAARPRLPIIEGEDLVHFVYRSDADAPAIAGDFIGMRHELPMVRIGESDLFYFSSRLHPGSRVSYAFVPEDEPVLDPHNPLQTRTTILDEVFSWSRDGSGVALSELRMPGWELPAHLRDPDPLLPRGQVETLSLATEALGDLDFNVYLPAGYTDSEARYPVVYYHGPTPAELSAVPLTLDHLIAGGMQPVMAVFSEAPVARGAAYVDMWANELVPAVDERFRTIAEARGRVGVGVGRGGAVAMVAAFAWPEMSSGLALHTPIVIEDTLDRIEEDFMRPARERPLRVYIDWGIYDLRSPYEQMDFRDITALVRDRFREHGFEPTGGEVPDAHGWASWRNRADVMLRAILPPDVRVR